MTHGTARTGASWCRHGAETDLYFVTIADDAGDADLCGECISELRTLVARARDEGSELVFAWDPADMPMLDVTGETSAPAGASSYRVTGDTEVSLSIEEGPRAGEIIWINGRE